MFGTKPYLILNVLQAFVAATIRPAKNDNHSLL